jgi:type 1 glutamine amidotransferase
VLWARQWEGGRVLYDALGHNTQSLDHPVHRQLIARAAAWLLGRESPSPAASGKP